MSPLLLNKSRLFKFYNGRILIFFHTYIPFQFPVQPIKTSYVSRAKLTNENNGDIITMHS